MNYDQKLIQNGIDEINRLNNQLKDLETYKDDFTPEEIEQMKKETLDQLIETKNRLDKLKSGEMTTMTKLDEARNKLNEVLSENYKVKDLISLYLNTETSVLRDKLKSLSRQLSLNKITIEEYNTSVIQILEIIAKNDKLNEEEQKLYDNLKKKNMNQLQEDKGIDKEKIEQNISQKK